MEGTNVDVVKAGFEAMTDGGFESLMPLIHPDFEMTTTSEVASEPDTYSGEAGVRRYFASFYEAMDSVRLEPEEFIEVGDLIVTPMILFARGRTTGIEMGQPAVGVWEVRDGLVAGLSFFTNRDDAIADARERSGA